MPGGTRLEGGNRELSIDSVRSLKYYERIYLYFVNLPTEGSLKNLLPSEGRQVQALDHLDLARSLIIKQIFFRVKARKEN